MLVLGMLIIGILTLRRGEFNLGNHRKLVGPYAERVGTILLLPVPINLLLGVGIGFLVGGDQARIEETRTLGLVVELVVIIGCLIAASRSAENAPYEITVPPRKRFSLAQAARQLRISPAELRRQIDSGEIQAERWGQDFEVSSHAIGAWRAMWQGKKHLDQGDLNRALDAFSVAIAFDLQNANAFLQRAVTWYRAKRYTSARNDFKRAKRLQSDTIPAATIDEYVQIVHPPPNRDQEVRSKFTSSSPDAMGKRKVKNDAPSQWDEFSRHPLALVVVGVPIFVVSLFLIMAAASGGRGGNLRAILAAPTAVPTHTPTPRPTIRPTRTLTPTSTRTPDRTLPAITNRLLIGRDRGLYLYSPDGTSEEKVVEGLDIAAATWSPDSKWIAFLGSANSGRSPKIMIMNADGSDPHSIPGTSDYDYYPTWSPDSKRIAFVRVLPPGSYNSSNSQHHLYIIDIDGSNLRRLTESWFQPTPTASFTPTTGPRTPTRDPNEEHRGNRIMDLDIAHIAAPDWSPDGKHIIFSAQKIQLIKNQVHHRGTEQLYIINEDGSGLRQLTNDAFHNKLPVWSPDGKRLVFTSNRESRNFQYDLYVMNADGSNVRRISTLATAQSSLEFVFPSWSPDRQHIVATLVDGNRTLGIYIFDVDTAAIHRVQYDVYLRGLTSYPRWKPS